MIPVDQTEFNWPESNCFSACVASILHLPISDVPTFAKYEDPWEHVTTWLKERGFYLYDFALRDPFDTEQAPLGFHIVTGKSPRHETFRHCVVAKGTEIVHDPHPSRAGIETRDEFTCIIPFDHGEFVRRSTA